MKPSSFPAARTALFALALAADRAVAQTMANQHVSSAGVQATWVANGDRPSVSDDDRFVAYASQATNLVGDDANAVEDVFVHDNLTGATVLVSRTPAGAPSNGSCRRPWLSSSGRYVSFQSNATNLVAGVAGVHVYRRDRDTDADGIFDEAGATATIVVSTSSAGVLGNGASRCYENSISDDGDRVAFESDATNLVAGDTNGQTDCFVRTISTGTTVRVSVSTGGAQATIGAQVPAISGDGGTVAFDSSSSNLVAGDTNATSDVFARVLATSTTTRISVSSAGAQSNGYSNWSTLSDSGTRIAFHSSATNLVAGDTNGSIDVFVRDLSTGTTVRASVGSGGLQALQGGGNGFLSGDGSAVVFTSGSSGLVPADTNSAGDVFLHVLSSAMTARASRAADGTQGNSDSMLGSASDDGSHVAFLSMATTLVPADTNGWVDIFLRGDPFLGAAGMYAGADPYPVAFSVNGPVDPQTEGIRDPRGAPPSPQVPPQPGNPMGYCIRMGPVPQANGIDSVWPGDVFDHDAAGVPSEAVLFQSPPFLAPGVGPALPDGTDNQILAPLGIGLAAGPAVAPPAWAMVPPMAPPRDNVDAFSFGEDYFPMFMMLGLATEPPLPPPPMTPMGEIAAVMTPWGARASLYAEPVVVSDGMGGVSFRFSNDPWAIGVPMTALRRESLGADAGAGCGPWTSAGQAAGDIFSTALLERFLGATLAGGGNTLVHDELALALAGPVAPHENDVDGYEGVGENTSPWFPGGMALRSGDLHARVMHVGPPGPPPPGVSAHDPVNDAPVFFSVTRNSPGVAFSAVRTRFVLDGGAAGNIYAAVKSPMDPPGVGMNLEMINGAQIGLLPTDDLDALILRVCPEYRDEVSLAIDEILGLAPPFVLGGFFPWGPPGPGDTYTGGGMTISITEYLDATGRPAPPNCIKVGFSVTTDSIGMEYTAVDWEAGPVFPPGGVSAAAGDVFYAPLDGTNYLWHEEVVLGEDPGTWVPGASMDLADLPDNLDGLDSIDARPDDATYCYGDGSGTACPCAPMSPAGSNVGCPNSLDQAGSLRRSGVASISADSLVLEGSAMPNSSALYLQGTLALNGGAGAMNGDGLVCVGGATVRMIVKTNVGGASQFPSPGDPSVSVAGGALVGTTRFYQVWYRDTAAFCTPAGYNFTNGVSVSWAP